MVFDKNLKSKDNCGIFQVPQNRIIKLCGVWLKCVHVLIYGQSINERNILSVMIRYVNFKEITY